MRINFIATILTGVLSVAAIWGPAIIIVPQPKDANAAPAPPSIDVMQMMKDASNLPVERFDAH